MDAGAIWSDVVDGNGTLTGWQVNYLVPGEYRLVLITDQAGNSAQTILRNVTVVDTTPPVVTLNQIRSD